MAPADDYGATGMRVAVVAEIAALGFKFDEHALPSLRADLKLGLAVREFITGPPSVALRPGYPLDT